MMTPLTLSLSLTLSLTLALASLPPRPALAGNNTYAGCQLMPTNSVFNARVDALPLHPKNAALMRLLLSSSKKTIKADWGSEWNDVDNGNPHSKIGIPINSVPSAQPLVNVQLDADYAEESDGVVQGTTTARYPFPANAVIEEPGDSHVLVVRKGECKLYEVWQGAYSSGAWSATNGAIFDLNSNAQRTDGWTSADAAGFPIAPLLVRYDEVYNSPDEIQHAFRFTVDTHWIINRVWPATHKTSSSPSCSAGTGGRFTVCPRMGERVRLNKNFPTDKRCVAKSGGGPCMTRDLTKCDCSQSWPAPLQKILRAWKAYGMMLADGGSNWYVSGAHDMRWDNDLLAQLRYVWAGWFEVVDQSSLIVAPTSYAVKPPPPTKAPTAKPTKRPTKTPTKRPTKAPTA